jgi:lysophospholipase L1-like esterase
MGGANDGWIDYRRGSGKTETDTNTIYGALNKCFSTLLNSFPNADIIVILQPVNYNYSSADWTEEQATSYGFKNLEAAQSFSDYQLGQYAMHAKESIVKEMAEMYGLPIADCCFEWFSVLNPNDRAKYWASDKLHLTNEGYNEVYNVSLEKAINNLKTTRN